MIYHWKSKSKSLKWQSDLLGIISIVFKEFVRTGFSWLLTTMWWLEFSMPIWRKMKFGRRIWARKFYSLGMNSQNGTSFRTIGEISTTRNENKKSMFSCTVSYTVVDIRNNWLVLHYSHWRLKWQQLKTCFVNLCDGSITTVEGRLKRFQASKRLILSLASCKL